MGGDDRGRASTRRATHEHVLRGLSWAAPSAAHLPVQPTALQLAALTPPQRAHLQRALRLPPRPQPRPGLWGALARYQACGLHDCLMVLSTLLFLLLWSLGLESAAWSGVFAAVFSLHFAVGVGASGPMEWRPGVQAVEGAAAAGAGARAAGLAASLLPHAPALLFAVLSWLELAAYFSPALRASSLSRLTVVRSWVLIPYLPRLPLCGSLHRIFNALLGSLAGLFYVGLLILLAQVAFALMGLQLWAGMFVGGCGWPLVSGGPNGTSPAPLLVTSDPGLSNLLSQQPCPLPSALQLMPEALPTLSSQACPSAFLATDGALQLQATQCVAGVNPGYGQTHFDNFGAALFNTYVVITTEGWGANFMYNIMDFWGGDNAWAVFFFFAAHIVLSSYVLLELALAELLTQYNNTEEFEANLQQELLAGVQERMVHRQAWERAHAGGGSRRLAEPLALRVPALLPAVRGKAPSSSNPPPPAQLSRAPRYLETLAPFQRRRRLSSLVDVPAVEAALQAVAVDIWWEAEGCSSRGGAHTVVHNPLHTHAATGKPTLAQLMQARVALEEATPAEVRARAFPPALYAWAGAAQRLWGDLERQQALLLPRSAHDMLHRVTESWAFYCAINALVLANALVLVLEPALPAALFSALNLLFVLAFVCEAALKMGARGLVGLPDGYWRTGACALEGVVTFLGVLEVMLGAAHAGGSVGALYLRLMRVARMLRLFFILRLYPQAWVLLRALASAVPQAAGALFLYLLFILLFALLGRQLFGSAYPDTLDSPPPFLNFRTLFFSMLAVFQVVDQENWDDLAKSHMSQVGTPAVLYFTLITVLGNLLFLNLFISILVSAMRQSADAEADARLAAARAGDGGTSLPETKPLPLPSLTFAALQRLGGAAPWSSAPPPPQPQQQQPVAAPPAPVPQAEEAGVAATAAPKAQPVCVATMDTGREGAVVRVILVFAEEGAASSQPSAANPSSAAAASLPSAQPSAETSPSGSFRSQPAAAAATATADGSAPAAGPPRRRPTIVEVTADGSRTLKTMPERPLSISLVGLSELLVEGVRKSIALAGRSVGAAAASIRALSSSRRLPPPPQWRRACPCSAARGRRTS